MALEMIHIFVFVYIFNFVSLCVATVESHGQAFIQTDNELRFMGDDQIDGVPPHVLPGHNNIQDMSIQDGSSRSNPIRFDPPLLDFREQPVGMPNMEHVTVHNPDTQNSLHLLSISGSTLHFHCSFFQDKMVPPGGNTTFDVVFLARQVGNVENTLYIHTSQGSFRYQVFGVGIPNPYRIRPFLGAKVPINSSFSPLIRMHNPHTSPLQVVEMYSSGGDLHLELPTGEKEAPKNLWEIPPFETKPVMRASFIGRIESNHTAFIRIKTNREKKDEVLILPVEVEVTAAPGIFSPLEMLDFGILRTLDGPKTLRLNLLNSGSRPVHITSISVSPPNDAISIEFRPVKLLPNTLQTSHVAQISYSATKALHLRQWSGKIVIKSKNNQYKINIPYQANVLHGSLVYDRNKTMFYTGKAGAAQNVTRELTLTNTFNFTTVIYNVTLPKHMKQYFSVSNFTEALLLKPQQSVSVLVLTFHPSTPQLHLTTELQLLTNASVFNIPIVVYNGKLKVVHHRPEIFKGQLDFGTMGVHEKRNMIFTLRNDNPVDVVLSEFGANMEHTKVELLGVERGNATTLSAPQNTSNIDTNPLVLKPYHFAVFSVNLIAPDKEGTFAAEVIIVTQYENLYIPMTLRTAEGSLNAVPEKLLFGNCFPNKAPFQEFVIFSSFDHPMEVQRITFQPNDSRFFYFPPRTNGPILLEPHRNNSIGRIYFDVKRECGEDCYTGLPTSIPAGHQWLLGATLDKEVADTDQYLYTRFQQKWQQLNQQQLNTANVALQLDTNAIRGFLFPAQAHLSWPSMVDRHKIRFPLTQIGNLSILHYVVENPSDVPVLAQILPLSLYPNPQTIVDLVNHHLIADLSDYIEMDDLDVFTLQDHEQYNVNEVPMFRKSVENLLGVKPHPQTITMMMSPNARVRIQVGFQPKDDLSRTSLIVIRNNLTIVDAVVVQGQGGRGEMRFSNRKPGSQTPLLFEMTEKHLKGCDTSHDFGGDVVNGFAEKRTSKSSPPHFIVKRTFTMRNTGQLPFYVLGFSINDSPCEGYGFKVFDCVGFELQPNTSRKIEIAFTPDFTMSRMRRVLSVYTSLGPCINYTLQASLPAHMLTKCAAALPRPAWEPILYYSTICVMGFLLFCILIASYFEADRIFTADILKRRSRLLSSTGQVFDKSKVFDLKTIAGVRGSMPGDSGVGKVVLIGPRSGAGVAAVTSPTGSSAHQNNPASDTPTPNGHLQPRSNKKKQVTSYLSAIFKWLFSRTVAPPTESNNNTTPSSGSSTPDITSSASAPLKAMTVERTGAGAQPSNMEVPTQSKTLNVLKLGNNKKSRGGKRQSSDLTDSGSYDRGRQNGSANGSHLNITRKLSDTDSNKVTPERERASTLPPSGPRRGTPMNTIDSIDVDVALLTEEMDTDKKDLKRMKGRRMRVKPDMAERMRERTRIQQELPDNDKDDTSSTTTESSSAEADEKTSSARESTPEPVPNKKKARSRKDKKRSEAEEEDGNEEEFVITSRSKAHKKIKVDPKNSFGGNILRPSTLELPYTTKLEAAKADKEEATQNSSLDKAKKSTKKTNNHKTKDLSEIALQTEAFAAKHGLGKTPGAGLVGARGSSPDNLTSSSRSSSYSSVVSNGSTNNNDTLSRFKYKIPGMNSMDANTRKAVAAAYGMDSGKHPGAIGTKTVAAAKPLAPTTRSKNPWNPTPGSPTTPDTLLGTYGLTSIQETQHLPPVPDTEFTSGSLFGSLDGMGGAQFTMGSTGLGVGYEEPDNPTMMQKLARERRRRYREYQQKLTSGEEWPGFNMNVQQESLWDMNLPPADAWSTLAGSPSPSSAMLWDTPLVPPMSSVQSSSTWNPAVTSSIWNSEIPADSVLDSAASGAASSINDGQQHTGPGGAGGPTARPFDPFNTLGSIWNPSSTGSSGPWGFTPNKMDDNNM